MDLAWYRPFYRCRCREIVHDSPMLLPSLHLCWMFFESHPRCPSLPSSSKLISLSTSFPVWAAYACVILCWCGMAWALAVCQRSRHFTLWRTSYTFCPPHCEHLSSFLRMLSLSKEVQDGSSFWASLSQKHYISVAKREVSGVLSGSLQAKKTKYVRKDLEHLGTNREMPEIVTCLECLKHCKPQWNPKESWKRLGSQEAPLNSHHCWSCWSWWRLLQPLLPSPQRALQWQQLPRRSQSSPLLPLRTSHHVASCCINWMSIRALEQQLCEVWQRHTYSKIDDTARHSWSVLIWCIWCMMMYAFFEFDIVWLQYQLASIKRS